MMAIETPSEWKPGDVAMVRNEYGVENVAILQVQPEGQRWVYGVAYAEAPLDWPARPVVIIDPEDAEQVERLRLALDTTTAYYGTNEHLAACLREFARPTPRIEEPQGLGAVVVDYDGNSWVKVDTSMACDSWTKADAGMQGNDTWVKFERLHPTRVLSHGVTEGES